MVKETLKRIYFLLRRTVLLVLFEKRQRYLVRMDTVASILVLRTDRVGDLVLTTPLLRQLREHFPHTRIAVMALPQPLELLKDNPHIDELIPYTGFLSSLAKIKGRFDLVIDPLMDYRLKTALLALLSRPGNSLGFNCEDRGLLFTCPLRPSSEQKHFVSHLLDLLRPLGIEPGPDTVYPEIFITAAGRSGIMALLYENGVHESDTVIAVHPGGFYPSQRWPADHFAALVRLLLSERPAAKVLLLGTTQERTAIDRIHAALAPDLRPRAVRLVTDRLLTTIYLINSAHLFIGNNSGPLHIAAALKVPTLSMMGPTVPWLFAPFGSQDRNVVLRHALPCSPCSKASCKDHSCLADITVDEAYVAAQALLRSWHDR